MDCTIHIVFVKASLASHADHPLYRTEFTRDGILYTKNMRFGSFRTVKTEHGRSLSSLNLPNFPRSYKRSKLGVQLSSLALEQRAEALHQYFASLLELFKIPNMVDSHHALSVAVVNLFCEGAVQKVQSPRRSNSQSGVLSPEGALSPESTSLLSPEGFLTSPESGRESDAEEGTSEISLEQRTTVPKSLRPFLSGDIEALRSDYSDASHVIVYNTGTQTILRCAGANDIISGLSVVSNLSDLSSFEIFHTPTDDQIGLELLCWASPSSGIPYACAIGMRDAETGTLKRQVLAYSSSVENDPPGGSPLTAGEARKNLWRRSQIFSSGTSSGSSEKCLLADGYESGVEILIVDCGERSVRRCEDIGEFEGLLRDIDHHQITGTATHDDMVFTSYRCWGSGISNATETCFRAASGDVRYVITLERVDIAEKNMETLRAISKEHIKALLGADTDALVSMYDNNSEIIVINCSTGQKFAYRGFYGVERFFNGLFSQLNDFSDLHFLRQPVHVPLKVNGGGLIHFAFKCPSSSINFAASSIALGDSSATPSVKVRRQTFYLSSPAPIFNETHLITPKRRSLSFVLEKPEIEAIAQLAATWSRAYQASDAEKLASLYDDDTEIIVADACSTDIVKLYAWRDYLAFSSQQLLRDSSDFEVTNLEVREESPNALVFNSWTCPASGIANASETIFLSEKTGKIWRQTVMLDRVPYEVVLHQKWNNAALCLQGAARQVLALRLVEAKREEIELREKTALLALLLQRRVRQKIARRIVSDVKTERKNAERACSATLLQGRFRQHIASKKVATKRTEMKAVTSLQCAMRTRFAKDRVAAKRSELERLAEESSKATATKVEGEAPENLRTYRRASQQNPLSPASVRYFHSFSWAQNFFQKLRNGIRCEKVTRRGTFCSRLLKIDDNLSTLSWPSRKVFGVMHAVEVADIVEVVVGRSPDPSNTTDLTFMRDFNRCVSIKVRPEECFDFRLSSPGEAALLQQHLDALLQEPRE